MTKLYLKLTTLKRLEERSRQTASLHVNPVHPLVLRIKLGPGRSYIGIMAHSGRLFPCNVPRHLPPKSCTAILSEKQEEPVV